MVLDWNHLREIVGGDQEFARALLAEFASTGAANVQRIADAIPALDRQGLLSAAHSLKGSSRTIGATDLASASEALEHLAPEGDPAQWAQAFGPVQQAWSDLANLTTSTTWPSESW